MTALPRLERNGSRLLTVEGEEMGGVRLNDVGGMGAPEERLLRRNLLAIASGIGRNSTVGFGKGKTQRDQWAKEPGLGPRTWRTGAARTPSIQRFETGQRTMREPIR